MTIFQRYEPRPATDLRIHETDGGRIKVDGIGYARPTPRPELVGAAHFAARTILPRPATGEGRYGVGFMGVHDAVLANPTGPDFDAYLDRRIPGPV